MTDLLKEFSSKGISPEQLKAFAAGGAAPTAPAAPSPAKSGGGALKAVQKQVTRNGKTFTETYWLSEAEVRSAFTAGGLDGVAKKMGADPKQVQAYVQGWVDHSGSEKALELRGAWGNLSGTQQSEASTGRMVANYQHFKSEYEGENVESAHAKAAVAKSLSAGRDPKVVAVARTITAASQAAYKDEMVTLYRGVSGEQANQIKEAMKRGDSSIKIAADHITSFTDDKNQAHFFAKGEGGQAKGKGVVIKVSVPKSSIVASHLAVKQMSDEKEVLISSKGGFKLNIGDVHVLE